MSNWPFRFIHASDLHLDQMPSGLAEVPDHLRDTLIDVSYQAAELVFDTALVEEVDFVILSGDVLDPRATGPRGPAFLYHQFQRLAEQGIQVYWACGQVDQHDDWPGVMNLPSNVHLFPQGKLGHFIHQRNGQPLVKLIGTGYLPGYSPLATQFGSDDDRLFNIAVMHGKLDQNSMQEQSIAYWALGGSHKRLTLATSPTVIHYPGTPQGRNIAETGPHGCTVVNVDDLGKARTSFVSLDSIRWHTETLQFDETADRKTVEHQMRIAVESLARDHGHCITLVKWMITGSGKYLKSLRNEKKNQHLLKWLRAEFGHQSPQVWSLEIATQGDEVLPARLYEQETILGDYLRIVRDYQADDSLAVEFEDYLNERHLVGTVGSAVSLQSPQTRREVFQEVSLLGLELLSGDTQEDH